MSNKTRNYRIQWSWKVEGNRIATGHWQGPATTVPRAISKLVKDLNEQADQDDEEKIKAAELMILDVRTIELNPKT